MNKIKWEDIRKAIGMDFPIFTADLDYVSRPTPEPPRCNNCEYDECCDCWDEKYNDWDLQ